jgi:hypothetical protein
MLTAASTIKCRQEVHRANPVPDKTSAPWPAAGVAKPDVEPCAALEPHLQARLLCQATTEISASGRHTCDVWVQVLCVHNAVRPQSDVLQVPQHKRHLQEAQRNIRAMQGSVSLHDGLA